MPPMWEGCDPAVRARQNLNCIGECPFTSLERAARRPWEDLRRSERRRRSSPPASPGKLASARTCWSWWPRSKATSTPCRISTSTCFPTQTPSRTLPRHDSLSPRRFSTLSAPPTAKTSSVYTPHTRPARAQQQPLLPRTPAATHFSNLWTRATLAR